MSLLSGLASPAVYFVIFFGKVLEVCVTTLRIIFVGKGRMVYGTVFGFVEIVLWIIIAGEVLGDLQSDPMKAVVYCLGFTAGIAAGVAVEHRLAIGLTSINIVVPRESGEKIATALRESGFGVTILEGHAVGGALRQLVLVQLRRKNIKSAVGIARGIYPNAVISISEVQSIRGGFLIK